MSEKAKHLIMPISIGSVEFYKILLENISSGIFKTQAISFESLFSIYVIIWEIFAFILDICGAKSKKMILAQFIISLIFIILGIILVIFLLANKALIKNLKNQVVEERRNAEEPPETERNKIKAVNSNINKNNYPINLKEIQKK